MKILSITAQKPDSTGSGVFLTELVKGFDVLNCRQAVICGAASEDPMNIPGAVKVYPVFYNTEDLPFPVCGMSDEMPYPSTRYRDLDERMTVQLLGAFRKRITDAVEEFQPDVILCHHLYFLCALVRDMYPHAIVYGQCHGSDLRQLQTNSWLFDWIRSGVRRLDGILALHEAQKQQICQLYDVPDSLVTVVGTGYNSSVFYESDFYQASRNASVTRLIFAGKLSEKKGVFSLLRALHHLQHPEAFELVLAGGYGDPAEYEKLLRLAAEAPCKITFLNKLDQQQLAFHMNSSHIFVLPSFYEGLPLVLIEAMACGLHTVCTDLPGIRPWLDRAIPQNGTVFVAPPRMYHTDIPIPEDLPAFEQMLAHAIETASNQPLPDIRHVKTLSWDSLCRKLLALWKH